MIGTLRGNVLPESDLEVSSHAQSRALLIDVGGVGYLVQVPLGPEYGDLAAGRPARLFIHTHVREDALDLYGFLTALEKAFFLLLQSVSGIGPRAALAILSGAPWGETARAITEGDQKALVALPGVGKRLAERLVVELRDKIADGPWLAGAERAAGRATGATAAGGPLARGGAASEAEAALEGLGYRGPEIERALGRVRERNPAGVEGGAEAWIRQALRELGS